MDEKTSRRLVQRYIDDTGTSVMVSVANGAVRAWLLRGTTGTDAQPVWFLAGQDSDSRRDKGQSPGPRETHIDAPDQSLASVSGVISMMAYRDAMERRSRGPLGGAFQQNMMMPTSYEPSADPVARSRLGSPVRPGAISGRVLLVLLASTTLAAVALAVAYAFI